MKKLIFSGLLASCLLHAALPEPYKSANLLSLDMQGWFPEENKRGLATLIEINQCKTIIEVGSWKGASATYMASILPADGRLYAVDTWNGSLEHHYNPEFSVMLPTLYDQFLSNCIHLGVADKITPVRMTSEQAAKTLDIKADLIYIDASHEEEDVLLDVLLWYEHLNENGIICGDDWLGGAVRNGVMRAARVLNYNIAVDGQFWLLTKKENNSPFTTVAAWQRPNPVKTKLAPVINEVAKEPSRLIHNLVITKQNMNQASINIKSLSDTITPLMKTVIHKDLASTNWLMEMGVNVNQKSKNGMTALHYAAQHNNINAVRILLKNKANKSAKNKQGKLPTDLTTNKRIKQILLTKKG